jgi:hypothetical protein
MDAATAFDVIKRGRPQVAVMSCSTCAQCILADKTKTPIAYTQAYPNQGFQEQIKLYDAYCRGGGAQGMLGAMGAVRICFLPHCLSDIFGNNHMQC